MKLDSEIERDSKKLRNYLKKNNVIEARLRLDDGTIISYSQPSTLAKMLLGTKDRVYTIR